MSRAMRSAIATKSMSSIIKYSTKIIISLHYFFFNSSNLIPHTLVVAFTLQLTPHSLRLGFLSLLPKAHHVVECRLLKLRTHLQCFVEGHWSVLVILEFNQADAEQIKQSGIPVEFERTLQMDLGCEVSELSVIYLFFFKKRRARLEWISHRKGSKNKARLKQQYAATCLFLRKVAIPILFQSTAELGEVLKAFLKVYRASSIAPL